MNISDNWLIRFTSTILTIKQCNMDCCSVSCFQIVCVFKNHKFSGFLSTPATHYVALWPKMWSFTYKLFNQYFGIFDSWSLGVSLLIHFADFTQSRIIFVTKFLTMATFGGFWNSIKFWAYVYYTWVIFTMTWVINLSFFKQFLVQ